MAREAGRFSTAISAPVSDALFVRDHATCRVPGCGRVDVHRAHGRAKGIGGDPRRLRSQLWNLLLLCTAHHRLSHIGLLRFDCLESPITKFVGKIDTGQPLSFFDRVHVRDPWRLIGRG